MKNKYVISMLLTTLISMSLCGCNSANQETLEETSANTTTQETTMISNNQDKLASGNETIAYQDVIGDSMVAIYGSALNDGSYNINVDSSSSMFKILSCKLNVSNGEMMAVLNMSSTSYLYLYMGTGKEAISDIEENYILLEENSDGTNTFTIPVEALDFGVECSAFSKNKQKWYDRTLCFRADSLPESAFKNIDKVTPESLNLEDGEYTIEVNLEGGSGRASVSSPTKITIKNGVATALIEFSSPNYDYVVIDGQQYTPINTDGNSTFEIPVIAFDYKMPISADTTAMSTPHEIDYTLYFESSTIK